MCPSITTATLNGKLKMKTNYVAVGQWEVILESGKTFTILLDPSTKKYVVLDSGLKVVDSFEKWTEAYDFLK